VTDQVLGTMNQDLQEQVEGDLFCIFLFADGLDNVEFWRNCEVLRFKVQRE
jgi:hypothetical protein